MDSLTADQLSKLELLVKKTSPAPWTMRDGWERTNEQMAFARIADGQNDDVFRPSESGGDIIATRADAEFVVEARLAIPSLIAQIRKLHRVAGDLAAYARPDVKYARSLLPEVGGGEPGAWVAPYLDAYDAIAEQWNGAAS